jgi:hypothetical protein
MIPPKGVAKTAHRKQISVEILTTAPVIFITLLTTRSL